MRHIRELVALAKAAHPRDNFFSNLEQTLILIPEARAQYQAYDRALSKLDPESWLILSRKALAHYTDHRRGQRKQGFFNQINDALAYEYLVRRGYRNVRILPEVGKTQPDLEYMNGPERCFCEVKTIGISDGLIERRERIKAHPSSIYHELSLQFLAKLCSALDTAVRQIRARGAFGLIYVIVHFDDFTLDHYDVYRRQIAICLATHPAENIRVRVGLLGRRYIGKGSGKPRHGT